MQTDLVWSDAVGTLCPASTQSLNFSVLFSISRWVEPPGNKRSPGRATYRSCLPLPTSTGSLKLFVLDICTQVSFCCSSLELGRSLFGFVSYVSFPFLWLALSKFKKRSPRKNLPSKTRLEKSGRQTFDHCHWIG